MSTVELPVGQLRETPERPDGSVRFHLSLNVANLSASIAFYRMLFDIEPAKCRDDYAKFELAEPPLVLSLEPQPHASGGALNHLGFRLRDAKELVEIQRRLETAGISTAREDGVECCYAKQSKFWVRDPDRNLWEMYVFEGDVEHRGNHPPSATAASPGAGTQTGDVSAEVVWEHQLGMPFPATIPLADASADRILLRGTFNVPFSASDGERILGEARRCLKAGGRVVIHGLAADEPISGPLELPGQASAVSYVPSLAEHLKLVGNAGFAGLSLQKLSASPVFRHQSVGLREILLEGSKAGGSRLALSQVVIYKGPLSSVQDDLGNTYRRGEPARVAAHAAELLRAGGLADAFVFLGP